MSSLRTLGLLLLSASLAVGVAAQITPIPDAVRFDASKLTPSTPVDLPMGGTSPDGHRIAVNSRYLLLDGKPWLPIMGEFHYSRYPHQYWEEELLKMKAGGVQIVSTYVFWIHHEEIKGQFDWTGDRDLRRFITLCKKHGLYVFLRIGPYAHGEVRNGGLPDWVLKQGPTRRNDPLYLASVREYFRQIGKQIEGLRWNDGGPIIGLQLENEYYARGPGEGAAHISELKKIASESGIEAPIYTVTGWGNPDFPEKGFIPVFGGYPDNFWESSLKDEPPSGFYLFEARRDNGEMGGQNGPSPDEALRERYPYFMAEGGGGMQVAYHRRPFIYDDDVAAIALTRLGSGANLYGYYVFQGGLNPRGKLTTLNETAESDKVYDLPILDYDFQAPLGAFGQVRRSFRLLKSIHYFVQSFGSELATMPTLPPEIVPKSTGDPSVVRAALRTDGTKGFLFVNNYLRHYPLPERKNVQFEVKLRDETLQFPRIPVSIASGEYFIWPINLNVSGALLKYATAQPLTVVHDGTGDCYFFFAQNGIAPEFAWESASVASISVPGARITHEGKLTVVSDIHPGSKSAIAIRTSTGKRARIVVLTTQQASDFWKATVLGHEYAFLTSADCLADDSSIRLHTRKAGKTGIAIYPPAAFLPNSRLKSDGTEGVFQTYSVDVIAKRARVGVSKIRNASTSVAPAQGTYNALAPKESDFARAAAWSITLPPDAMSGLNDLWLKIKYVGDVAHLKAGNELLDDNFFNGSTWEIGLKRFSREALERGITLEIMPLRKDAPVYIQSDQAPDFGGRDDLAALVSVKAEPEYEVSLQLERRKK